MKKLLAALGALGVAILLVGCASSPSEEASEVPEDEIGNALSSPNDYKGREIRLDGQIFNKVTTSDGTTTWQAWYDPQNYSEPFAFTIDAGNPITTGEYVRIVGVIEGEHTGTNDYGTTLHEPLIKASDVEALNAYDAVSSTVRDLEPNGASIDHDGIVITVDQVQVNDAETLLYLTVANNSSAKFTFHGASTKIIQDGRQFDVTANQSSSGSGGFQPPASEIAPGAFSDGLLVFPQKGSIDDEAAIFDPSGAFQVIAEGASDDTGIGESGALTYTFDLPATTESQ